MKMNYLNLNLRMKLNLMKIKLCKHLKFNQLLSKMRLLQMIRSKQFSNKLNANMQVQNNWSLFFLENLKNKKSQQRNQSKQRHQYQSQRRKWSFFIQFTKNLSQKNQSRNKTDIFTKSSPKNALRLLFYKINNTSDRLYFWTKL